MRAAARLLPAGLLLLLLAGPTLAQYPGRPRTPEAGLPAAPREGTTPGDDALPAVPGLRRPDPQDASPREEEAVAGAPRVVAPPSGEARPPLPTLRLGALLPLSGPGAAIGKEIRQGIELAMADLNGPRRPDPQDASPREEEAVAGARADLHGARRPDPQNASSREEEAVAGARAASEVGLPAAGVNFALEAADVRPLDVKRAADEFNRLTALGVPVVFTASATPTLAIYPLASARNVLVVHLGVVTPRLPAASRTLLHARPPVAARVDALLADVAEQKVRRLALLAAGDEFGKTVRAAVSARWRERGGSLAPEESLTLDAPDLPARIRHLVRLAPEAVVLGFRGADLGDLAARLRDGGFAGRLYLLDDDPAVLLAAGPTLRDAVVVSDAFVGDPGSPGARFAETYEKRFGQAPSRYAAEAYDAAVMLAAGIAAAAAEGRPSPGGARLREALLAARSVPSVFGGRLVLRDDGTLARPLALFTVQAGKLAFVRHLPPPSPS